MVKLTIKKDRNVREAFSNVLHFFRQEFELDDQRVVNLLVEEYVRAVRATGASEKEAVRFTNREIEAHYTTEKELSELVEELGSGSV